MAEATARQPEMPSKPKLVEVIECLDAAESHLHQANNKLSAIIMGIEKLSDHIHRFKESFIKTVAESDGDIQASIEHQIKEFVPKNYRRPEPEAEQK